MQKEPTKKDTVVGLISIIFLMLTGLSQCQVNNDQTAARERLTQNASEELIIETQRKCLHTFEGNTDNCL